MSEPNPFEQFDCPVVIFWALGGDERLDLPPGVGLALGKGVQVRGSNPGLFLLTARPLLSCALGLPAAFLFGEGFPRGP